MSTTETFLHREDSYQITKYSDTEVALIATNYAGNQAELILNEQEAIELAERLRGRFNVE